MYVVLDVLLVGPDHLDRALYLRRDPDGLLDMVHFQAAPETAAHEQVAAHHAVQWETGDLGRRGLGRGMTCEPTQSSQESGVPAAAVLNPTWRPE